MRILRTKPTHWTSPRAGYFLRLYDATPSWLTRDMRREFHAVYRAAARMREGGRDVHVHHVVPLNGETVCGLNVPWNLQIVDSRTNLVISNHLWPDMPNQPRALPLDRPPQQMRLAL
jgi:hypothetical protein